MRRKTKTQHLRTSITHALYHHRAVKYHSESVSTGQVQLSFLPSTILSMFDSMHTTDIQSYSYIIICMPTDNNPIEDNLDK